MLLGLWLSFWLHFLFLFPARTEKKNLLLGGRKSVLVNKRFMLIFVRKLK